MQKLKSSSEFRYEEQRLPARRKLLNRYEVIKFDRVPGFIINAFFEESSYEKQIQISTFGYLNGIGVRELVRMIRWTDVTENKKNKIEMIYDTLDKPRSKTLYYSYDVFHDTIMKLDGTIHCTRR